MTTPKTETSPTPPSGERPRIGIAGGLRFHSTVRGALFLTLCGYLLFGPGLSSVDMVASVLGLFGLVISATAAAAVAFTTLRFRQTITSPGITLTATGTGTESRIFASRLHTVILPLHHQNGTSDAERASISVPSFVVPSITLNSPAGSIDCEPQQLSGSFRSPAVIPFQLRFPHRGRWPLNPPRLRIDDQLGLFTAQLELTAPTSELEVDAAPLSLPKLPVVSSRERAGDQVTDARNRNGDLYDLKQYHPADGAQRILWKIFAKRGELISRQPEASMTPEGQTAILVLARSADDGIAAAALQYAHELAAQQIELRAQVLGAPAEQVASSPEQLRDALLTFAWLSAQAAPEQQLTSFVAQLEGSGSAVCKIAIFLGNELLANQSVVETLLAATQSLASRGVAPVFFLPSTSRINQRSTVSANWLSLFFVPTQTPTSHRLSVASELLVQQRSVQSGWELHQIPLNSLSGGSAA